MKENPIWHPISKKPKIEEVKHNYFLLFATIERIPLCILAKYDWKSEQFILMNHIPYLEIKMWQNIDMDDAYQALEKYELGSCYQFEYFVSPF